MVLSSLDSGVKCQNVFFVDGGLISACTVDSPPDTEIVRGTQLFMISTK